MPFERERMENLPVRVNAEGEHGWEWVVFHEFKCAGSKNGYENSDKRFKSKTAAMLYAMHPKYRRFHTLVYQQLTYFVNPEPEALDFESYT